MSTQSFFTEDHELFRTSLRSFLDREVKPNIDQWEKDRQIPRSIWKKMGEQGFLGLSYPEEYGGSNLDFFFDVVFNEEIGKVNSGGFIITQQVVQYMSSPYILKFGSKELKAKYLPEIISGDKISCIGITEPGAGSDVQNIQTKAVKERDHYLVSGSKIFITNGYQADFMVAVVKTDISKGVGGISLMVIDLNQEGIQKRKLDKLGWHSSDTVEIHFDEVKVPVSNLIGHEGQGFFYLMNGLQLERLCFIPASVAGMEMAIDLSLQYMSERHTFGRSINSYQVLRHRIAQLASEIEALKSFSYYACQLYNENVYDVKMCSMAKLLCTELHEKVATQCLQFYGGYGYMEDYPMARMYRDVRVGTIGGGSSEIMREIISKIVIDNISYSGVNGTSVREEIEGSYAFFTKEHQTFRRSVRDFLNAEVVPYVVEWEKAGEVPREMYQKFGNMGYFGLEIDEKYGGTKADIQYAVVLHEELARINSGGFAAAMGAHFLLAMSHIQHEGTDQQKTQYLIPGVEGTRIGALAITEPFGGSDVKAIRTTAVKKDSHWVINGSKTFITNGVNSEYIIVAAKTNSEESYGGISLFIVEREREGLSARKLDKLGWRASDTGEIAFDDVRIPHENLLGEENQGFFYIMKHFVSERLSIAVASVEVSAYAIELTVKYLDERIAFGKKLKKFQVLRHRIAQMSSEIEMNRRFVYDLYRRYESGEYLVKEASMAKLLATQLSDKVTFDCLQMFGGYGFMEDYPMARMWRDSRLGQIGGGTSEIMREIIAKMIIDGKGYKVQKTKSPTHSNIQ